MEKPGIPGIIGIGALKKWGFYKYCPPVKRREGFFVLLWQVFSGGTKLDN